MTDRLIADLNAYGFFPWRDSRFRLATALVTIAFGLAMVANRSDAQGVIFHEPYPVISSHPVTPSYPIAAPHRVISSHPVASQPLPQPSRLHWSAPKPVETTVQRPRVVNENASTLVNHPNPIKQPTRTTEPIVEIKPIPQRDGATQLASTRRLTVRRNQSRDRYYDARNEPLLPNWRYDHQRVRSARNRAEDFRRMARSGSEVTDRIALKNANLADQWADLAESIVTLTRRVDDANANLSATAHDLEDVTAKLDNYGLTPTIGLLLRSKKEHLEQVQTHDSVTLFTNQQLRHSRQSQLELEMLQYDGSNAVAQASEILGEAGYAGNSRPFLALTPQVENLLHQRQQWLESLRRGFQDYQQKLGELDSTATESAQLTNEYRRLIDRHITWIRSGDPVSRRDLKSFDDGLAAFFDSRRSGDFGVSLQRKWQANPVGGIGLFAALTLLWIVRWRAKTWLIGIGNRKKMREASPESRKVLAGILTTMVALAFPSMLYAIARWLGTGVVSESTLHASAGLYAASLVALMIEVPRQLLRSFGYIDKHVDVEMPGRERATAYLALIGFGLVLAAYVITLMGLIDHGRWQGSISRFGFMSAMLLVAWTFHLSLRPSGGFLEPLIAKFGGRVIYRVRFVIYLAAIGFPIVMLVLSSLGYQFTAYVLIKRTIITLVSAMIAWTLWSGIKIMSARGWQMMTGATPPPRQFDEYGEITPDRNSAHVTGVLAEHSLELKHQLAFLCQCALVVGAIASVGWLWGDVLPNIGIGNPVVWTVEDTFTESAIDANGQAISETFVESTPITAFHLLLAAITMFVAFQLAKLLPAMFDALVLQRVSFDEGMEHFTLVLGRVLLFGVGCLVACKLVGLRWQAIQWLAVGLMIGLGFGLQDMVRNLFGGLIVLFEKPARLGDLITVGKIKGRVAAQKLRTTVLSDDEGREVTIPNKKFVSEEVVNWMGAGRLNVVPIEVAVSRDERPADICRSLQELILEQDEVLLSPAPQATLVCVGKSSQRIELRAWIEQGQDPSRYRDKLHRIVKTYLRENDWLSANQPSQPRIPSATDLDPNSYRNTANKRRRSA